MPGLISATGVLAFLSEEEPELRVFALQTLNDDIDTVWTEVAAALSQMYVSKNLSFAKALLVRSPRLCASFDPSPVLSCFSKLHGR